MFNKVLPSYLFNTQEGDPSSSENSFEHKRALLLYIKPLFKRFEIGFYYARFCSLVIFLILKKAIIFNQKTCLRAEMFLCISLSAITATKAFIPQKSNHL